MGSEINLGWPAVFMAAFAFSLTPVAVSKYKSNIPNPVTFNGLRALFALPIALIVYASNINKTNTTNIFYSIQYSFLTTLGPMLGDLAWIASIRFIGSNLATILAYTKLFFVQPAALLLGEKVETEAVIGAIVAFTGVTIAVGKRGQVNTRDYIKGILSAISAAILWGASAPLVRYSIRHVDLFTILVYRLIIIWLLLAPPLPRVTRYLLDTNVIKALTISGVVGWGVGMPMWLYAVSHIGSVATIIGESLVPIITLILSKYYVKEKIQINVLIGAVFVTIGVMITALI